MVYSSQNLIEGTPLEFGDIAGGRAAEEFVMVLPCANVEAISAYPEAPTSWFCLGGPYLLCWREGPQFHLLYHARPFVIMLSLLLESPSEKAWLLGPPEERSTISSVL